MLTLEQLQAYLRSLFSHYSGLQFFVITNKWYTSIEIRNAKKVSPAVLQDFVETLQKCNFQHIKMSVRNTVTDRYNHHFLTGNIRQAIVYRPRLWEQTDWSALYLPRE